MPERSFGRTVRYRRTKLGLSQAKLGELVGRSTATVRSWERDKSRPNDPKVLSTLAAILGIDEIHLFGKADVEKPMFEETSPTVEQALATLAPPKADDRADSTDHEKEPRDDERERASAPRAERHLVGVGTAPSYSAPPDPLARVPLTPTIGDPSYIEDRSQRQLYRVRTLATMVALVALVVAFIWALGEGLGALGEWWDGFFGQLRL
ncbi:MAG: helix-turn-helix domain-containing protein [Acidimicrobiia bacterium]